MNYRSALFLCFVAFIIRAAVFSFFIAPQQRYKQPDSSDYHHAALCISHGYGMRQPPRMEPLFWRTPGYPAYLSIFYRLFKAPTANFADHTRAHHAAIWVQIALSSLIPLIAYALALLISSSAWCAWIVAAITTVHPGLVLASTFLLTEGIAIPLFYLFLLLFFMLVLSANSHRCSELRRGAHHELRKERHPELVSGSSSKNKDDNGHSEGRFGLWESTLRSTSFGWQASFEGLPVTILAALTLSAYTWIRPMGTYIGLLSAILILLISPASWRTAAKRAAIFGSIFYLSILPWYVRNYQLTRDWFFCPTTGPYLLNFSAPKIIRATTGTDLVSAHRIMQQRGQAIVAAARKVMPPTIYPSPHLCNEASVPLIKNHPWLFACHWLQEMIKTTFDLHAYLLVPIARHTFHYDPIEEYLPTKYAECLYSAPLPLASRLICYAELLFSILLWIGLIGALWHWFLTPLLIPARRKEGWQRMAIIMLCIVLFSGLCIGLTGGFGYARLRLPVDLLLIIASLAWWAKGI